VTTLQLQRGDQRAEVSTEGGRLVSYAVAGRDLLAGAENPDRFAFRGALLAPWPNRIVGGRWSWQGRDLQVPVNEPAANAALHGLVVHVDFEVVEQSEEAAELSYGLQPTDGYPFPLRITVRYALDDGGLACALTAVNVGEEPAPVGLGVHPYIAAPDLVDDLVVRIPASTLLQTNDQWQETGRVPVEQAGVDFRNPRRIGDLVLDAAFTDVAFQGARTTSTVRLPDGAEIALWSGETCRWWLLYTGHTLAPADFRRSMALEPMTCPPNAFNSGEADIVQPGGRLLLEWGFSLRQGLH
jgi:aldose 1-epimerase